jgi:hypothetical protein
MLDLALRKELQGIHFWATLYVLIVLVGSLWHALRVRAWPQTEGQLLSLGTRPLGSSGLDTRNQDYVPSALYRYQVNGLSYEGREISIWRCPPQACSRTLRTCCLVKSNRVKQARCSSTTTPSVQRRAFSCVRGGQASPFCQPSFSWPSLSISGAGECYEPHACEKWRLVVPRRQLCCLGVRVDLWN